MSKAFDSLNVPKSGPMLNVCNRLLYYCSGARW